ncbi:MAG: hypothetical protein EOP82_14880 [Variovorax sp.]|nr:MAG: hypothetical protein EOP82_14880 [Variovorax sp.]
MRGDIDAYMANVKKFSDLPGVEVRVSDAQLRETTSTGSPCCKSHVRIGVALGLRSAGTAGGPPARLVGPWFPMHSDFDQHEPALGLGEA